MGCFRNSCFFCFRYLAVAYMTLVVVRRDLQVFILAVGHLLDLVVNKALKTWFAEGRPPGATHVGRANECSQHGSGMPQSIAQINECVATSMME